MMNTQSFYGKDKQKIQLAFPNYDSDDGIDCSDEDIGDKMSSCLLDSSSSDDETDIECSDEETATYGDFIVCMYLDRNT